MGGMIMGIIEGFEQVFKKVICEYNSKVVKDPFNDEVHLLSWELSNWSS
jgi:hypothetical protein